MGTPVQHVEPVLRPDRAFDCGAGGWLRVEVLDESGQAVQASAAVMGNGVCEEVPIGKLAGTPVRLRFEMGDARLYALQFLR